MDAKKILTLLAAHRSDLDRFGINSLALFGSFARNEAGPESDIDILVDFSSPATFDNFMDLKFFLEDIFGRRVDLVTVRALKPRIRQHVEKEARYVA
ncbi:MAG: nucleotidyltransferase family protein [Thermoleophilia bacterium]